MLFVGVDAHKSTSQVTVVDAGGQVLKRRRVSTSPEGFQQALGDDSIPARVRPLSQPLVHDTTA